MYNQDRSVLSIGSFTALFLESSLKICRVLSLEPSNVGRFVKEVFCQPLWVMVETMAVVDAVVSHFLFD